MNKKMIQATTHRTHPSSKPRKCFFLSLLVSSLPLLLLLIGADPASAQTKFQMIHQTNTVWSYHTNKTDPGYAPADAWTARLFDDSSWPTGKGYLGLETTPTASYNPGAIVANPCNCFSGTYITPPAGGGGVSSYFRTHFNWTNSPAGVTLLFTNWVDDSIVVYLNGTLLFSFNVSATKTYPLAWNDANPSGVANPLGEGVGFVTNVAANGLVAGDNVIGVQLQQQGTGSSDDVFTHAMWAILPTPVVITQQPTNTTSTENRVVSLKVTATGTAPQYQWYKGTNPPVSIPNATNATYTIANTALADTGFYFVVVSNVLNVVTSSVVKLTVSNDTNGPVLLSIKADESFSQIILTWDETITEGSAIEVSNYYVVDPSGAQIFVTAADYFGNRVVLHVPTMQVNTNYAVEIDLQTDLVGNPTLPVGSPIIDPNGIATNVLTWVYTPGLALFQAYTGLPAGQNIAQFVAMPIYPNGSSFSFYTNILYWPQSVPNLDQYAMRFSGFFVAPQSGLYHFNPDHDDDVRLRVYSGADPTGTFTELAATCCTGLTDGPTVDVTLTAGQKYYCELIVREYGGGDHAGISVVLPDGSTNSPISPQYLVIASDPANTPNSGIAQQPQNQTIEQNHSATFSVVVTNAPTGAGYQWQRDAGTGFTNIVDAYGPSYTTPIQSLANNGEHYRVLVNIPGRTLTSSAATLMVISDTNAPHVTNVVAGATLNSIVVYFDEVMDAAGAGDVSKYELRDSANAVLALSSPIVAADNRSVTLTTPTLTIGAFYTLHAQNVPDAAGNLLAPTNFVFQTGRGFVLFEAYDTSSTPGNAVTLLTSHPNYPNNPRERILMPTLDSRNAYPNDIHEQYGARISGWFTPAITTNYIFYLRSDDNSELWLSTNNMPTNKVKIQAELGCCNPFAAHPSLPQALVAGRAYYIELLYKEGTGGDYGQAAVKTSGDPADPNMLTGISGAFLTAADPTPAVLLLPRLAIGRSAGSVIITWPASYTGFTLETAPVLPSATWTPVSSSVVNGENTAIISIPASGNAFYRLRQ